MSRIFDIFKHESIENIVNAIIRLNIFEDILVVFLKKKNIKYELGFLICDPNADKEIRWEKYFQTYAGLMTPSKDLFMTTIGAAKLLSRSEATQILSDNTFEGDLELRRAIKIFYYCENDPWANWTTADNQQSFIIDFRKEE